MTCTPNIHDASFAKVCADHAAETAEDYVEGISAIIHRRGECRVMSLAGHMGVSHVTVVRTIGRLAKKGLVESEPYRPIRLTADGERLAAKSRRRHDIVHSFLLALGVRPAEAACDGEGMEHHVSAGTLARMRAFIAERSGVPGRSPASDSSGSPSSQTNGATR